MSEVMLFEWRELHDDNGEVIKAMVPWRRFGNRAAAEFELGETYRLEAIEIRSERSHRHYFASLQDAWLNLPEHEADRFPTHEHLRKWALIRAGYRNERTFVCASNAEARRLAAFLKPLDEYAIFSVREAVVIEWTAKSQSKRAMGAKEFQRSKSDVLDVVAALIGVDPAKLGEAA